MMEKKYHEIYGYLSQDEIDRLSEAEKERLFLDWINREPTPEGRTIVNQVIKQLGEEFLVYISGNVLESMEENGDEITSEKACNEVMSIIDDFAGDLSLFYSYVDDYMKENPEVETKNTILN